MKKKNPFFFCIKTLLVPAPAPEGRVGEAAGEDKSRDLFKFVLVLLSASVERVGVSRKRDFC